MSKQQAFFTNQHDEKPNLVLKEIDIPKPGPDQVLLEHKYIGINQQDLEYINKITKLPKESFIPGMEAIGIVKEIGSNVRLFKPGDMVGYATAIGGGFCQYRTIAEQSLFVIPKEINPEEAIKHLTKGMIAHMLTRRTFYLNENMWTGIYLSNSGPGIHLLHLAKYYKTNPIALCDNKYIKDLPKNLPGNLYSYQESHVADIMTKTDMLGLNVIYDFIGQKTAVDNFKMISAFGLIAICGFESGIVEEIPAKLMQSRSCFLTFPKLQHYKTNRHELFLSAGQVFGLMNLGVFKDIKSTSFNFTQLPEAIKHANSTMQDVTIIKL